jgi:hypothetical protein
MRPIQLPDFRMAVLKDYGLKPFQNSSFPNLEIINSIDYENEKRF